MHVALQVFWSIIQTFTVFAVGAFAVRIGMIRANNLSGLSRLALDVFFPFLTFSTIVRNFNPESLNELWIMPAIGFGIMFCGAVLGILLRRFLFHSTPERHATLHHLCAINNYVFLPLIVIDSLWGERHIALLLLMNVGSTIGFWTIGILTFTGMDSLKESVKNIFSVNLIAVFAALLCCFLRVPVPAFVMKTSDMLGGMAVPFMLILTGAALYFSAEKLLKHPLDALYISVLRLLVLPGILIFLLKQFPLEKDVLEVCIVVALMPAAASSVLIAKRYGGCPDLTGQSIIVTTLLSLVTIPAWLWFLF